MKQMLTARSSLLLVAAIVVSATVFATSTAQTKPDTPAKSGWRIAYEHRADGSKISGNLKDLVEAVRRGASVKIVVRTGSHEISEIANRVWIHDDRVFASTLQYFYNFKPDSTSWDSRNPPVLSIWGTDGTEKVYTRHGSGQAPSHNHRFAMAWCVD